MVGTRLTKNKKNKKNKKSIKVDYKTLIKQITDEEKDINDEISKQYLKVQKPSDMPVFLNKTKMIQG